MASAPLNRYNRDAVKCIAHQDSTNPSIPHRYTGRNSQITNDRIVYKKDNGEEIKLPLYNEKSVDISLTPNHWIPFATPSGIQYLPIYSINNPTSISQIIGANGTRSNFTTVEGKACNLCYENCNTNYVNCERCVGGCNECNECQGCQSYNDCKTTCNANCYGCYGCQGCTSCNTGCNGTNTCQGCVSCNKCNSECRDYSKGECISCNSCNASCVGCYGRHNCYGENCGTCHVCQTCDSGENDSE